MLKLLCGLILGTLSTVAVSADIVTVTMMEKNVILQFDGCETEGELAFEVNFLDAVCEEQTVVYEGRDKLHAARNYLKMDGVSINYQGKVFTSLYCNLVSYRKDENFNWYAFQCFE